MKLKKLLPADVYIQRNNADNMKNGDETIRLNSIVFRKTPETVQKRFLILIFIFLLLCAACLPANAEGEQNILISDDYQIMRDGDVLKFEQGYEITLKGFGADTVLVEFHNNYSKDLPMGNVVLKEGETVQCYRILDNNNKTEILMMTLDKLYLNNSQVIVGFSHIYQFEDGYTRYTEETVWTFETAVLDDPSVPQKPGNTDKDGDIGPDFINDPLYIIIAIGLTAAALVLIKVCFRKRVKKKETLKENKPNEIKTNKNEKNRRE